MLYHPSGKKILPGNCGEDCPLGRKKYNIRTDKEEDYCTTCHYLKCCLKIFDNRLCGICYEKECPRSGKKSL